ncbi:CDP-glucose 4,6-dehydratase [Fontisphaera persica]|uniref:CDP-glucose 4,6-dehydratase n=1 Tax=Fontisphaera persica TaxID=2974023 RepID=UPI0024BFD373|nr:CDP-glucose 4,6-dehydratase [Fontisphaera persica]WCJ58955.1 CDP-glucose 4,6-dehydratase [Fontisphaera persica]
MENLVGMFQGFYAGRRVLVTGHTGFKGAWLCLWLRALGARVSGFSLPPPTQPSLYELLDPAEFEQERLADVRNFEALAQTLRETRPDIVFHLAAQALVRRSYREPLETFSINALGTAHLLEALRQMESPAAVVVVTSDKCYDNQGWDYAYREGDPLGGHDVYSMSKGAAELVTQAWRRSFFEPHPALGPVASARAGNVIGGGDYAEDRLIPDCVRALLQQRAIGIRNPAATRPWQHVLDCLSGYLWLGARLATAGRPNPLATAFNFGPGPLGNVPVQKVVELFLQHWPGQWQRLQETAPPKEAPLLNLAIDKAVRLLEWQPVWGLGEAVAHTARWYYERHVVKNADMAAWSRQQIEQYCADAAARGAVWTRS